LPATAAVPELASALRKMSLRRVVIYVVAPPLFMTPWRSSRFLIYRVVLSDSIMAEKFRERQQLLSCRNVTKIVS